MSSSAPPPRGGSHYAMGTAANMVRSLGVIGALTLAIFLIVGRTNGVTPSSVDVPAAAAQHAQQAGQPFAYPRDLPKGWTASNVRYVRSVGDVLMWNAGYTTPDGQYVAVQQVLDPPQSWIDTQVNKGTKVGTWSDPDGTTWQRRDREGKVQRSLIDDPAGEGALTTLVTGTGSWEQLEDVAERLAPVELAQTSPSGSSSPPSAESSSPDVPSETAPAESAG